MSAALQNAAVQTNNDYRILHSLTLLTKRHKRHQTQQISVTWNLEVLQFLDDSKKDLEMLTVILLLDL